MSKQVPWDVIPDNTGVVLPAGLYLLEIDSMEETNSSTGKYMIKGTFKVVEPDTQAGLLYFDQYVIGNDSDLGGDDPKTWATSVGAKIFKEVMNKAGVMQKNTVEEMCHAAKGNRIVADLAVEVETKNEKYMGKERNRARRWYRVGERPVGSVGAPTNGSGAQAAFTPAFRPGA